MNEKSEFDLTPKQREYLRWVESFYTRPVREECAAVFRVANARQLAWPEVDPLGMALQSLYSQEINASRAIVKSHFCSD